MVIRAIAVAAAALIGGLAGVEQADAPAALGFTPPALFVIGDSLSDVGNAAAVADSLLNQPIDPPTVGLCNPVDVLALGHPCDDLLYRRSRISDGPVAVEHLALHFGLPELRPSLHLLPGQPRSGTVYAVAGAKARAEGNQDLASQVDWLLINHAPLPPDAVFVVMIGGNDALDALRADVTRPSAVPRASAAIVTSAVDAIGTQVERLLDYGARQLVVANVPDLAAVPAVRGAARVGADEAARLAAASAISAAFDAQLSARLDAIEAKGAWLYPRPAVIRRFDLRAALDGARDALGAAGANTTDACFASDVYRDSSIAQRIFHPSCAPLSPEATPRFAEFVFFDGIHPTSVTHAALGASLSALF
jgi:phospholipase/lecithinase/hemolysin